MTDSALSPTGISLVPLCVDLDGTLIRSDTLVESVLALARSDPASLLRLPFWLLGGRSELKSQLARRSAVDVGGLPYRAEFLSWVRDEAKARPCLLVTAAHRSIAEDVAAHVGCFGEVLATETVNLKAARKAEALVARFGTRGFDYAGDADADLPVWAHARQGIVVGARPATARAARAATSVVREFDPAPPLAASLREWARALRVYQWVKNLLLLVAPAAAHVLQQPDTLAATMLAVLAFCVAASSVYVLNDLLDLRSDRAHPRKRHRPFAAGTLPLAGGLVAAPLLLGIAFCLAAPLGTDFVGYLCTYVVLTTAYSLWLKRKTFIDVAVLASLYTLRVAAGAAAADIGLSSWLLAVCAYGFLGLALLKRFSELAAPHTAADPDRSGRGYLPGDAPVVLALGVGASLLATLVTALYIDSPASRSLYAHPELLWILVALMLLGVGRVWLKAGRGEVNDDPIVFVVRDRWSVLLLALAALAFGAAT